MNDDDNDEQRNSRMNDDQPRCLAPGLIRF